MVRHVRWGILSTARIGVRRVLPALLRARTGKLHAVASRDLTRARAVATQFNIPRVHGSYEALLADPEVDAIYIPLPNSLHMEWTVRAAQAGKHVLCEKPLGVTAAEAQTMVEAAARAGVLLQEAFMYRFHPQTDEVLRRLKSGVIGTPWLVRAAFTFGVTSPDDIRLNASLGGGGLLDVGCYCVNVSRLLLGEPQSGWTTATFERGVDVRLAGMLRFATATALIDCGLRAPYRQLCEIVGSDGSIWVPRPFQPEEDPGVVVVRSGKQEDRVELPGTNQYTLMIDHMGTCILEKQPPRFPADDAVANMRVLDALAASARSGQIAAL
ncbi:MAG TPA: Gfo/Idh/MocA family oxidoreductase [bacterium]|nr:Gfo/Idh/MocA family oxidoreductase [bacterium]